MQTELENLNHDLIEVAINHQRGIVFAYAKGNRQAVIERRRLLPEGISRTRTGELVVTGVDPDRDGDPRAYRLDRIKGRVGVR